MAKFWFISQSKTGWNNIEVVAIRGKVPASDGSAADVICRGTVIKHMYDAEDLPTGYERAMKRGRFLKEVIDSGKVNGVSAKELLKAIEKFWPAGGMPTTV